jgi:hypothetical protein
MGYACSSDPLTDAKILSARYQIDIAGELQPATPHLRLPCSDQLVAPRHGVGVAGAAASG